MTRKSTDDVAWLSSVPFFEEFPNDDLHRAVDLSQQM